MITFNLFALVVSFWAGIKSDSKFCMFCAGGNFVVVWYALIGAIQ